MVTTFPADVVQDLQDFILWQPDALETGVEAVYVMVRSPRYTPGKVSGKGQQVGDGWLNTAGQELGSPVPSQIADKLRGREFASFDSFRSAFWKAVAADPELSKQFGSDDMERLKLGRAPTVRFKDSVGKRVKYEIHHRDEVAKGGEVYNVDNLNVVTPKRHIEIHKGK
ncbi:hypothetical protein SMKC049_13240 [Serratia marcescens]|nr:hypothetical protein SMKC049_13240 [Serratia marcescens]